MKTFKFDVSTERPEGSHVFNATVKIDVEEGRNPSDILQYLRSTTMKNDFMNNWVATNAPGYGIEVRGGPRPVYSDPKNRESGVCAYEQDFRLTRPI